MKKIRVEVVILSEEDFTEKQKKNMTQVLADTFYEEGFKAERISVENDSYFGTDAYKSYVRD